MQAFRYQPIFGHPPPDGITNLIPVTRAVERDQRRPPACRFAPVANYRYRGVESRGARPSARPTTSSLRSSLRHWRAQREDRLPVRARLDLQDDDLRRPDAAWLPLQPARRRTRSATTCLRWAAARSRKTHGCLRAGHLDAGSPDAAGRCAGTARPAMRRLKGTAPFGKAIVPEPAGDHDRGDARASTRSTTSRRAWAWRPTCSASGQTALKLNWGKLSAHAANDSPHASTNPGAIDHGAAMQGRGWTDGNNNKIVDCNLRNTAASSFGGDPCAAAVGARRRPLGQAGAGDDRRSEQC